MSGYDALVGAYNSQRNHWKLLVNIKQNFVIVTTNIIGNVYLKDPNCVYLKDPNFFIVQFIHPVSASLYLVDPLGSKEQDTVHAVNSWRYEKTID